MKTTDSSDQPLTSTDSLEWFVFYSYFIFNVKIFKMKEIIIQHEGLQHFEEQNFFDDF